MVKKIKNSKDTKLKFDKSLLDVEMMQILFAQGLETKSNDIDMVEIENLKVDSVPFTKIKEWKLNGIVIEQLPICVQLKKKDLDNQVPTFLPNSLTPEMVEGMVTKTRPLMEDYTDPNTGETSQRQVIEEESKTRFVNKFIEDGEGELRPVWEDLNTGLEYVIMSEEQLNELLNDETKSMAPVKVEETYTVLVLKFEEYPEAGLVPTGLEIQKTWREYLRGIVEEEANGNAVGSLEYLSSKITVEIAEQLEGESDIVAILNKKEYKELAAVYRPELEI